MTCKELSDLLLRTPDSKVKIKVNNDWHDIIGVGGTGRPSRRHKNDISITVGESDRQPNTIE